MLQEVHIQLLLGSLGIWFFALLINHKMEESSACVPSLISLPKEDSNLDDISLETLITGTWDRADEVLQNLKDSQSELLSRVQKLKEEIEHLNYAHTVEVERLRMELQSRAKALKDQLDTMQQNWQLEVAAMTTPVAKLASAVPKASSVSRKGKI